MARPKNGSTVQNQNPINGEKSADHAELKPAIDPEKLRQRMRAVGIETVTELAEVADIARSGLHELLRTGHGTRKLINAILATLQISENELLRQPARHEMAEPKHRLPPPNYWTIESIESPCLQAANGVRYQVAKLSDSLIKNHYARGKFYDLLHLPPAKVNDLIAKLTRHATVCNMLSTESRVANFLGIRPMGEDTAWWVLDEWVDSTPLSLLLDSGMQFDNGFIKQIGTELLLGLSALHREGVIVRELAPERILIVDATRSCVITDFELAQLLAPEISVSGEWQWDTPYRAPEVSENDTHFQSDLFSWAVIVSEMLTGTTDANYDMIQKRTKSKRIASLIREWRDELYYQRHKSLNDALEVWAKWKV